MADPSSRALALARGRGRGASNAHGPGRNTRQADVIGAWSAGGQSRRRSAASPILVIFRPELVARILAGDKTQTRRLVRPGLPCRYRADRTYAVQPGRTKHGVARIRITDVRTERLSEITEDDARREGFASVEGFFAHWDGLHGAAGYTEVDVWVISFALDLEPGSTRA